MSMVDVEEWFRQQGWRPFAYQRECWSAYLSGESGLIHAPTGMGKTYAAYFGPLLQTLSERKSNRRDRTKTRRRSSSSPPLRLIWLTPLRALARDTAMSLELPLKSLGLDWDVGIRTGDTSSSTRARQARRLPTVLVTTPESLSLFLSHADARERFSQLQAVIIDEWHELLASKRGVQTELALARLRRWRPELQTWGISATLGNLNEAMDVLLGPGGKGRLIQAPLPKQIVIDSVIPENIDRFPWAGHIGLTLLPRVIAAIEEAKSCLVFTNTRAQTEIWYQAILEQRPAWAGVMALHHGSLDRKVRDWVEDQLAEGKLRCVVCTSSLDLGVDFSPVDRVIQIGSPKGVARLLQRAGRSGHQPGAVSRVTCVPTNALELLEIAAARDAARRGAIEGRYPVRKPLDVLAQHVVTIAAGEGFDADALLEEVRQTYAYKNLHDTEWEWVLDFVTRGGDTLRAYPEYHRVTIQDSYYRVADNRVARRHRMSIGTIVSEAAIQVRFLRGGRLGTIEESFITRLKPGDRFIFAGRILELVRVHELTAWVRKARPGKQSVPRWMGGRMPLSTELSSAVREQLDLCRQGRLDSPETLALVPILDAQESLSIVPGPDEFLIERLQTREGHHLFFYPFEGRLVHEGLAALFAYRLGQSRPLSFTAAVNDYGFELLSPDEAPIEDALSHGLLSTQNLGADVLSTLNAGELTRRQFREVARIAGLVYQGYPGSGPSAKQLQASSGLLFNVFQEYDPENLLLHQARSEVLERHFEEGRLAQALERLQRSRVRLIDTRRPTPLAFPLFVERLRDRISTEKLADRIRRITQEFEKGLV